MATLVYCEDDPTIRRLIQAALRPTPHELHLATDGVEGLDLIERLRPDAVFTDVAMPGLDGLQLCDLLRAQPHLADIPIIVVTASVQRGQLETIYHHGATAHLAKPFSAVDLRAMVERVVELVARRHILPSGPTSADLAR